MKEIIEISIDSEDGIIDCRLDLNRPEEGKPYYTVTILYPHIVNGFSRSEIYCYDMKKENGDTYSFSATEEGIHPKILKLEKQLSAAIS
jgi:hypothetical protein